MLYELLQGTGSIRGSFTTSPHEQEQKKKYTHVFHSCRLKNYKMKEAPKYKNYLLVSWVSWTE